MRRLTLLASAILFAACARGPSASEAAAAAAASAHLDGALAQGGVQCEAHEPPPVEACEGKAAGAPCLVVDDEGAAQGACKTIPDGRSVCAGTDADDRDGGERETDRDQGGTADAGEGRKHDGKRPPPLALVAACAHLAANAPCTAQLEDRTISGDCKDIAGILVCLPPSPPPPAPVAACAKKSAGAACTVTVHDKPLAGTCRALGEQATLACIPAPGPLPLPHPAVDACVDHAAGTTCSFVFEGHSFAGACLKAPGGTVVCAPTCGGR